MTRDSFRFALVLAAIVTGGRPSPAAGQSTAPGLPPGFSLGVTVDRYRFQQGLFGGTRLGLSFRGLEIRREKWTSEFAIGGVFEGAGGQPRIITASLGAAHNAPLWRTHILFRGGATGMVTAEEGGAMVGLYGGIGVVGRIAGRLGFRLDAEHRRLHVAGGHFLGATVFSLGLVTIPRAAPTDTIPQ